MITNDVSVAAWVCEKIGQPNHGKYACFGWLEKGQIVAGIIFDDYNGANIYAHAAGRFYGAPYFDEFMTAIWDYTFRQLGCKRVTGTVKAKNLKCIDFYKRVGFEEEILMIDASPDGNVIQIKLTKENCRWIK